MKFSILFLFFTLNFISAQEASLPPEVEYAKDSLLNSRQNLVSADSILSLNYYTDNILYEKKLAPDQNQKYRGDDFNYKTAKAKESVWTRIKRNIAKILNQLFGGLDPLTAGRYTIIILRFLGLIVIGFLLYFLIKYLNAKQGNFFFGKTNRKNALQTDVFPENIHELNFPVLIAEYENKREYRYAIRYRFLEVLKKLSNADKIKWTAEKTNYDYISEISGPAEKQHFTELTYIFDNVWYGEFPIDESAYKFYSQKFSQRSFS